MIILGLTGSIAMGKSFIAKLFKQNNIPLFDADYEIRNLLSLDRKVKTNISKIFPEAISNNEIDRDFLGKLVFNDKKSLKTLENILHPLIEKKCDIFIKQSKANKAKIIVLDIPLLFEKNYQKKCDKIIIVSSNKIFQYKRALGRKNITKDKLKLILAMQIPDSKKRAKGNFIINTGASKYNILREIKKIIREVTT